MNFLPGTQNLYQLQSLCCVSPWLAWVEEKGTRLSDEETFDMSVLCMLVLSLAFQRHMPACWRRQSCVHCTVQDMHVDMVVPVNLTVDDCESP